MEETIAAKGDSAETALNVCGDDETKVVEIRSYIIFYVPVRFMYIHMHSTV